jgi:exopolyphosphatase/guanosine-5'-triphosphate,3'-diphosphate pyrophosphatase
VPVAALRDDTPERGSLALVPAAPERSAAVIDLGSNSWRFVAYRYVPRGAWRPVGQLQEPVRIAAGLAATGRVAPARISHGLETLEMFARYGSALGVDPRDTKVVATSALRDAANGADVLARARRVSGLEVRTLTAAEEAHLGYVAAVNSTTLTDGLALDLGGGSLQVVDVRDREARGSACWPLGAVRVTEELLSGSGLPSRKQLKRARAALREQLDGVPALTSGGRIVGMGGAVRNLATAAMRARSDTPAGAQGSVLTLGALRDLTGRLARRPADRRALPGIKSSRGDIILAAALVLEAVLDRTGGERLEVTRAGLREGVFFTSHLHAGEPPLVADVRAAAVRNLATAHGVDAARAERVTQLALGLHDSLRSAGIVAPSAEERELLAAAATLHDISTAPAHARDLLLGSDVYGFGPRELALVAQIVRYHRKGTPALDDVAPLARPKDARLVARCALLLRLATQLAPGRDTSVRAARLVPDGERLRIEITGDERLARWALARCDDQFPAVFGRSLDVAG